ncbi:site-2 protease family protein [Candidatus Nanohalovita haloferacivicina]|uniref:site-2 protease family protein n=1 Tax=Candidatus Nanohalovita haloferacivicina TaxID=2978046 RepID=UPI00325FCEB8|nr:Metalloprotease [Candidatus Nanohalobia archaeon BNXNv]
MIAGLEPRVIFSIIFLAALAAFLWYDRNQIQRVSILFYRRTKHGIDLIDRIAKKSPRFWNIYGWAGVATGLISMPAILFLAGSGIANLFSNPSAGGGPALIAPGLSGETTFQSGISFIPVEYWLISIMVLMVVHEFSHGIVARAQDFELNSVGWLIMGVIPGAFVEPKGENMLPGGDEDMEEVKENGGMWDQGTWTQRLKVLCAGSFANYVTAAVFFLLATATVMGTTMTVESGYIGIQTQPSEQGLQYQAVEGFPAYEAGMRNGTLQSINGTEVSSVEDLRNFSNNLKPNQTLQIETSEGDFTVETIEYEYREFKASVLPYAAGMLWFISLLNMVAYLNFVVGFFNMLPAKPLDGGQVVDAFLERFYPDGRGLLNYWSLLVWLLLLGSLALGISVSVL